MIKKPKNKTKQHKTKQKEPKKKQNITEEKGRKNKKVRYLEYLIDLCVYITS